MSFGTGAGKGSLPRKVDLNTYHNNYDNIFRNGKATTTTEPKPEGGDNLQEEPIASGRQETNPLP
jgi:hypothetical protein